MKSIKSISELIVLLSLISLSLANVFAQSPIPAGAKLDTIAAGYAQPEGPVWKDGLGLLFSDIARNRIYQWSPSTDLTTTYLNPSYNSNGLTFDAQERLILTQMQLRRVSRQESNGAITPLASTFRGKKFNSPNDLVVKSDGSIFFTDPDYNIPTGQSTELGFKGIYRISPSGDVQLLDSTFNKPNGICFSPDESKLYVNDVNFSPSATGKIYVWDIINDSTIANKALFFQIPSSGYVDGMKTDTAGNIYCTGPTGVWIISPDGNYLDKIATPRDPSNCAWGDADRKTLYITTGNGTTGTGFVYRIRLALSSTGIENQGSVLPDSFQLNENYPNPFNPSTTIGYQLAVKSRISLKVFDLLGREIAVLVNEEQAAGRYWAKWEASGYPSGAYFSRLHAGNFIYTQKMILSK